MSQFPTEPLIFPATLPPAQPSPPTVEEVARSYADTAKNDPGFFTALGSTSILYDVGADIARSWYSGGAEPGWQAKNSNEISSLLSGIPYEYHDDILDASSLFDARAVRDEVLFKMSASEALSREGATGVVASLGVGVLEFLPAALVTGPGVGAYFAGGTRATSILNAARVAQASGRISEAAKIAGTFSRAGLLARGGMTGIGSAVAYTAVDSLVDPTIEASDFLMSGTFGVALGAGTNAMFGRSLIKNNLLNMASKYEKRMTMAGKELAVRFGSDDIVEQVKTRFGVDEDDARAILLTKRALSDPQAGGAMVFEDLAVAGPKARLRAGQEVVESFETVSRKTGKKIVRVEQLNDGKVVLRSLQSAENEDGFIRGIADVLFRRVVNEDNPNLGNTSFLELDELLKGAGPKTRRTVGVTIGVEEGQIPAGLTAADVRLGRNYQTRVGSAVKYTPATQAARAALVSARKNLEQAVAKVRETLDSVSEQLTEADIYENFVNLAKRPEAREPIAALKKAAKEAKDAEMKFKVATERDVRSNLAVEMKARADELKAARADLKKVTKEFGKQERRAAKVKDEAYRESRKRMEMATRRESQAVKRLKDAEELLGDLDAEFMILKRKTPFTAAERERFASAFIGWLKRTGAEGVSPSMDRLFTQMKDILLRVYADSMDPFIGGVNPSPRVDQFFRDVFRQNIDGKLQAASRENMARSFSRLSAIMDGVAVGAKEGEAPPVPGSLPKDWNDAPRTDLRILGVNLYPALRWLNQSAAAQNSEDGIVRWLGNRMFWSRIAPVDANGRPVPQRRTIFEEIGRLNRRAAVASQREYDRGFTAYVYGTTDPAKVSVLQKTKASWAHSQKEKFNRAVYDEIISPGSSDNEGVKIAAEAYRAHYKKMAAMAEDVGLPGFAGIEPDGTYFPRLWSWEIIDELTKTEQGFDDFAKMIRESITIPTVKSVEDKAFKAGEAITEQGRDALALKVAKRLRQLARGDNKDAYTNMDDVMLEILVNEAPAPIKGKGPYMTPRGRRRVPMDLSRKVLLSGGRSVSLSEYVVVDVIQATNSYNRSVFGAIGEKILIDEFRDQVVARGVMSADEAADSIKNWADVRTVVQGALKFDSSGKDVTRVLGHLDEMMAGIRSEPSPSMFSTAFSPYVGRLLKLGYLYNGQAFGLSSLTETGRIIGRTSASSILKQLEIVKELQEAARKGRMDPAKAPLITLLDQALGVGSDRLRRAELGIVDSRLERHSVSTRQGWWSSFNNWVKTQVDPNLNQAAVFMSDITGLAPITSATQHLMAASLIQEIFDSAKKGVRPFSDELIAQWGLTVDEFDDIVKRLSDTAKVNELGRVIDIDRASWTDSSYGLFLDFVERGTISSIQDPPSRGDFAKVFWSDWGRLLTQFRTFNIKGISNFAMTSLQRRDARVAREYIALGVLGTLVQMGRKALFAPSYKDEKEYNKWWEDAFSNKALVGYFMSGPTENYLLTSGIDTVSQLMVGETVFSQNVRYSNLGGSPMDISSTPAYSVLRDVAKSVRAPIQALLREDREFSQKDLHAIRSIILYNKILGVSQGMNALERGIAGYWNLPEKSAVKVED